MISPKIPADEQERCAVLHDLGVLDSAPEERFDRLTRLAGRLFSVPVALVSLVDEHRQWFKSSVGLAVRETPRNVSFCGHAIGGEDVFVVEDATKDERFWDNPLVTGEPHIRFYAGCPLRVAGYKVGTLCLIDQKSRHFSEDQVAILKDLAEMASAELEAMHSALIDDLTGLANRRGFLKQARSCIALCRRHQQPLSLLYMDLRNFKAVNDGYGHAEGDRALCAFARALQASVRVSDVIARQGGDEFLALLAQATPDQVDRVLEAVRQRLQEWTQGCSYRLEFSAGVVAVTADAAGRVDLDDLLRRSDALMYEHKRADRTP